jgi:hypothetical protein
MKILFFELIPFSEKNWKYSTPAKVNKKKVKFQIKLGRKIQKIMQKVLTRSYYHKFCIFQFSKPYLK